jgi:hypothetical protein
VPGPQPHTDRPGDRRFSPGRSVGRERFDGPQERSGGQARLNWQDRGVQRPVKNLGWLQRNSQHVSNLVYERGQGSSDAVLRAQGQHPDRGHFDYEIPFADREVMRNWVGNSRSRWNHVSVEDRLRDGGA